jgi:hypothetical protein
LAARNARRRSTFSPLLDHDQEPAIESHELIPRNATLQVERFYY